MRLGDRNAHGRSEPFRKVLIEIGSWLLDPVIERLAALGVAPQMLTGFSLVPGLGAGVALAFGWFALACVLGTLGALCELARDLLARRLGAVSKAGELLDAAADRWVESVFLCGLIIHYRSHFVILLFGLGALFGSFMMSYATAKAEAMRVLPPPGLLRRAERRICMLTASGLTSLSMATLAASPSSALRELPIVVAVAAVAMIANASAAQRLAVITHVLRASRTAPIGSSLAATDAGASQLVMNAAAQVRRLV